MAELTINHYRGSQLFDAPNRTKKGNRKITTAYVFTIVSPQLMECKWSGRCSTSKVDKVERRKKIKNFSNP